MVDRPDTANGAVDTPPDDALHVQHLGSDEHRSRRVRWFHDPNTEAWRRVEPWITTLVNAASGQSWGSSTAVTAPPSKAGSLASLAHAPFGQPRVSR